MERGVDVKEAERCARDLLLALGADPGVEGLRDTPRRVASTYAELLTLAPFMLTTFANYEGYDELVVVRDIPFHSLCMHHLLPFHGPDAHARTKGRLRLKWVSVRAHLNPETRNPSGIQG